MSDMVTSPKQTCFFLFQAVSNKFRLSCNDPFTMVAFRNSQSPCTDRQGLQLRRSGANIKEESENPENHADHIGRIITVTLNFTRSASVSAAMFFRL